MAICPYSFAQVLTIQRLCKITGTWAVFTCDLKVTQIYFKDFED